jgi:hypothetical protein
MVCRARDEGGGLREIATALDPDIRISAIPLAQIYRQDKLALRLVAFVLGGIVLSVLLLSAAGIFSSAALSER